MNLSSGLKQATTKNPSKQLK